MGAVAGAGVLEENWDSVDQGGDGVDSFTSDPGDFPRTGPSGTCALRKTYSDMGDWGSVDRKNTGNARSKVGKLGHFGSGVWVQSKFDLAAFAGETVRIRLLVSGISIVGASGEQWAFQFEFSTPPPDFMRGWIVDNFRVTGTAN